MTNTLPFRYMKLVFIACTACAVLGLVTNCGSVQIQAPDKPIDVNVNVNVQHKIEIDNKLDKTISGNKNLF